MRLIINAHRWHAPIDSNDIYNEDKPSDPLTEVRFVQQKDGRWTLYTNGDPDPKLSIEPHYEFGERVFLFGDHEEVNLEEL
jgi:hypothetical protein